MTLKPFHIIIAGLFFLSGCSDQQYTPLPTTMAPETPVSLLRSLTMEAWTPTSTFTPSSTNTRVPATVTLTPTSVPTTDPVSGIRTQCLDSISSLPEDTTLQGSLVLGDNFLNLETRRQTPLLQNPQIIASHQISPDRTNVLLGYCSQSANGAECTDVIRTVNQVITTYPHIRNGMYEWWLDNERLIYFIPTLEPANTVTVMNPFSGEVEELTLDLPNPYFAFTIDKVYLLPVDIDPTLTRVVYFDSQGIGRIIMWDITSSKMLAWLPYPVLDLPGEFPYYFYPSGWSPDGTEIITSSPVSFSDPERTIPMAKEVFSINRDGLVTQLTRVSAAYEFVYLGGFEWSPDSRSVAFWLYTDEAYRSPADMVWRLATLDITTQEMVDYCISSPFAGPIIWSPDGKYIVTQLITEDNRKALILIDPDNNFVYTISEDLPTGLYGWMISP